jgi:hypothetical protein
MFVYLKFEGVFSGKSEWQWNILVAGFAIIGIVVVYDVFFEKLTISESGIEHRSFLRHVFLQWNEVEEIPARFAFKILIGKSLNGKGKQSISLFLFADNPTDSDLGQQIKQHAPHLFEKEKSAQSV